MMRPRLLPAALTILAVMSIASGTRADFEINVYVDGVLIDTITPTSGPSLPSSTPGTINVDTAALNADIAASGFGNITFNNLTATSNQPTVTGLQDAIVGVNGNVIRVAGPLVDTIEVLVGSTDFSAPTGPATLVSSASDTFSGFGPTNNRSFLSYYDPLNGQNSLSGISPGIQTFVPTAADPSTSGTSTIPIGLLVTPFSLTNDTLIALGNNTVNDSTDRFGGTTTIRTRAVPEPTSVALLLAGLSAIALGSRCRLEGKGNA